LREEDKEERRGLGEGSHFGLEIFARGEGEGGGKLGEPIILETLTGTVVAGNFGLRGQETARIPGAREPERLFLVGWEVNIQFGQLGRIINNQERG
jgi:hypothetical protein